jgi:hypothetical protein
MISDRQLTHHHHSGLALCAILAVTFASACSDDAKSPTGPTPPMAHASIEAPPSGISFGLASDTVVAQPVSHPQCPSVTPFLVPFVIIISPNSVPDVVVTQIQMQFTDIMGSSMPMITLPAPVPTREFGSALAAARGDLRFPLNMGIGCGVGRSGTISVGFSTRDGRGHEGSGHLKVNVR